MRTSQDANIHVAELDASAGYGSAATLDVRAGRQAYVLCVEGSCELRGAAGTPGVVLARHDAAEVGAVAIASCFSILHRYLSLRRIMQVTGSGPLTVQAAPGGGGGKGGGTHVLVVEMAYSGDGRTDL